MRRRRSGADSGEEGDSGEERSSRTLIELIRTSIARESTVSTVGKSAADNINVWFYFTFSPREFDQFQFRPYIIINIFHPNSSLFHNLRKIMRFGSVGKLYEYMKILVDELNHVVYA